MYREQPCLDVPFQNQNSFLNSDRQWAKSEQPSGNMTSHSQYQQMGQKSSGDQNSELDSCYLPDSFFSNFLNTQENGYDLSLSLQRNVALSNTGQSSSGMISRFIESQGKNVSSTGSKQGDMNFASHQSVRIEGVAASAIDESQSLLNFLDNFKVTERKDNCGGTSPGCDVNYSVGSPWSTGFNNDSDADCFAGFMGQDFRQNNMWNNSEASKSFTNASVMSRAVASPVYDRGFQHSSGHSGNLQSPSNLGAQTHFGADRFDLPSATSSCFYDNFQSGSSSISTSMRNPIVNGPSKHQQVHRNSNLPIFTDPFLTRPTSLNWSSKCEERVGAAVESASQIMVPQQVCISSMSSGYAKTAIGQVTANDTRPAAAANKPAKRLKPFSVNRKSESSKAGTLKEGANTNDPQRLKTINDGFGSRISEDVKHLTKALDTEPISAHKGHGFSVFSDNMATNLPFSGASNSGAALCTTSSDSSSFSTPASTEYIINSSPFDNLLSKSYEKASEGSNNQSDPPAPELVTMLSVGSTGSVKSESEHVASPVSIADLIPTPGVSIVENPISVARTQTRRICHSKSYLANTELNKEAERKRSVGVVFPITSDWKIEEESKPANVVAESTKPIESGTISRKESTGNNSTASSASWIFSMSEKSSGNTAETGSPVNALSVADLESFEAEAFGKVVGDKSPEAAKVAVEQVEPEKDDKEGETPEPKEKLRATKRYDREQIMSIGMNERTKVEPKVADENKDWFSLVFIGNNAEEKRTNTAYEICSRPFNSAVFNAKKVCLHPAFQKALLQSVSDK